MSTQSQSFQPVASLRIVSRAEETFAETKKLPADDGLGCMRGFAFAMLFNLFLVGVIAAAWGLYRLLR